jgi:hypothetical protein
VQTAVLLDPLVKMEMMELQDPLEMQEQQVPLAQTAVLRVQQDPLEMQEQ